jgi:signal transduction histidine kinase
VNISEIVNKDLSMFKTNAISKKITLFSDVPGDLQITSDKNMLNTILRNLLNNAMKSDDHVLITVKDTGIGISEEDIDKLFRIDIKFSNIGMDGERGTGLGLILCREFTEKLGGKIWVESVVNQGSEFKFIIPLQRNPDNLAN